MDIGDYARHARIWDWGGFDDTAITNTGAATPPPMAGACCCPCAPSARTGAYLAERGFDVTAYDITPEMIAEGRRRFGHLPGLHLLVGDVRSFRCDPPAADFCCVKDFRPPAHPRGRASGVGVYCRLPAARWALVIEAGLPVEHSSYTPPETFYSLAAGLSRPKGVEGGRDPPRGRHGRTYIAQTVYIEHECGALETFEHAFYLQATPMTPGWTRCAAVASRCGTNTAIATKSPGGPAMACCSSKRSNRPRRAHDPRPAADTGCGGPYCHPPGLTPLARPRKRLP
jgi:hypothetical protein